MARSTHHITPTAYTHPSRLATATYQRRPQANADTWRTSHVDRIPWCAGLLGGCQHQTHETCLHGGGCENGGIKRMRTACRSLQRASKLAIPPHSCAQTQNSAIQKPPAHAIFNRRASTASKPCQPSRETTLCLSVKPLASVSRRPFNCHVGLVEAPRPFSVSLLIAVELGATPHRTAHTSAPRRSSRLSRLDAPPVASNITPTH
ncbi:hypothetical protein C7974DRAFT_206469 [Boeremia exigua]|uniref:uncharacterized protein n=1 Tax=Boeremia exigua TaxID=749465 RepID=UPI001E8E6DBA|nr:uncharacterized protein C7974DRAFT_206469 [Boeremia exigua]KAH6625735.1 hypothetical protein C7974DRAFT_206469 [Boeremia exigua]